jgi:Rieske Fe-S protein
MTSRPDSDDRRNFLRIAVIGGVAVITGGVGAASAFVPPKLGDSVGEGPQPLVPMRKLGALAKDKPLRVQISLSARDGWRLRTRQQLVYVVRVADGDIATAFKVLNPICSHAGCTIDYHEKDDQFVCPCHGAEFTPDGTRTKGPAPRDMDPLEAKIADHRGQAWLFVTWQDFVIGSEEPIARGSA